VKTGLADFNELAQKLSFVKRRNSPNAYLIGTPANLKRLIPEEDAKLIIESLK